MAYAFSVDVENYVGRPCAWRNWLSVGTTSSRFAAPPFLPPPVWFTVSRAFMFEDKPCKKSLGLEPSLRASSLYAYGIMCPGPLCLRTNDVTCPWAWSRPCGPVPSTSVV